MKKGLFITVEGANGAGKTTCIKLIEEFMQNMGYDPVITKEPGGSEICSEIRELLLGEKGRELSPTAELLLFVADRAQHISDTIKPALDEGKIVVCDRFSLSSYVFQGMKHREGKVKSLDIISRQGIEPDMTILLDIDPETCVERIKVSGKDDRFDSQGIEYHKTTREKYLNFARKDPDRVKIVDASKDIVSVIEDVMGHIMILMEDTGYDDTMPERQVA